MRRRRRGIDDAETLEEWREAVERTRTHVEATFTDAAREAAALPVDRALARSDYRDLRPNDVPLVWVFDGESDAWHLGELLGWQKRADGVWEGDVTWAPEIGTGRRDWLHQDQIKPLAELDESEAED